MIKPTGLSEEQMPQRVREKLGNLKSQYATSEFIVLMYEGDGKETFAKLVKRKDYCAMSALTLHDEQNNMHEYRIVELGDRIARMKQLPRDTDSTVTYADEMAIPEIGFDGFGQRLAGVLQGCEVLKAQ
jgi:hypothetical protein